MPALTHDTKNIPVALTHCRTYERMEVEACTRSVINASGLLPVDGTSLLRRGATVLVKPNLLRAGELCCTHAQVVRALCLCLQEQGVKVVVADSPGFGTAEGVAASIGLTDALRPLGLSVQPLNQARPVPLTQGRSRGSSWGVSRLALECDAIISVPKVKAHCQMRASLAVKNLFGCVCGLRKAVAHTRQGHSAEEFSAALLDLWAALPPVAALADGVTAMHITGPSGGKPLHLNCLGASQSAMALDTALYELLRVEAACIPLWTAAQQRNLPGTVSQHLSYPLHKPEDFDSTAFILPEQLIDISFQPHRLLVSLCRRLWSRFKG